MRNGKTSYILPLKAVFENLFSIPGHLILILILIIDFRLNSERDIGMGGESEDIPRVLKCANVNGTPYKRDHLLKQLFVFFPLFSLPSAREMAS